MDKYSLKYQRWCSGVEIIVNGMLANTQDDQHIKYRFKAGWG